MRTQEYVPAAETDPAASARYRAEGWWRDVTYLDDFRASVRRDPDRVAIVGHRGDANEPEVLTFGQLERMVHRFAGALVDCGVGPGSIVAIQMPNRWEFAALALSCAQVGAVVSPLMPILREREVHHILDRTRATVCIVPNSYRGFSHARMLAGLRASLPALAHVFVLDAGDDLPSGLRSFTDHFVRSPWEERVDPAALEALAPSGDDLAQLAFSSGTTGEPKGVLHTFNTLGMGARGPFDALGLTPTDVVLMASPVTHQLGFLYGVLMPLRSGLKVVYQEVWDAATMLEMVEQEQVTWTMAATPFLVDAIRAQRVERRNLDSLRFVVSGGAPIPSSLVVEARQELGAQLVAAWGMTENGAVTLTGPDDPDQVVANSDGTAVPWMQIRVVDEQRVTVAPGEVGRLQVAGAAQCVGYYQRPDLYRTSMDGEWFDTGDLARLRLDGGVRITGRLNDLIIRGWENIPASEVESALYQHPQVAEVAVVGYPDDRLGERACALIVPAGTPPTLGDLTTHLAQLGMTKTFWPERLEIVEQLPKTASGKVQKFLLRDAFAERLVQRRLETTLQEVYGSSTGHTD